MNYSFYHGETFSHCTLRAAMAVGTNWWVSRPYDDGKMARMAKGLEFYRVEVKSR